MALAPGIRRTKDGFQVYVRVRGTLHTKHFRPTYTLTELKTERENLRARARLNLVAQPADRTFAEDAKEYLELVTGMPSYKDRKYHVEQWVQVFGSQPRRDITSRVIRAVLERWRKTGAIDGGPLSVGSLNRRRTALMRLFTMLDGKSAANPVKDVPPYDERHSEQIRSLSMLDCAKIIRRLRPWGKTRIRLHVLMWTGLPHQLLKELRPEDIDWKQSRIWIGRRKKGRGMAPAWVPAMPRAMAALRRFDERRCWGGFSNSSFHSAVARAAAAENCVRRARQEPLLPDVNPYTFRHSFGTWAAGVLKDDRALMELMRTRSIRRYTEGATAQRLEQAREQLVEASRRRA